MPGLVSIQNSLSAGELSPSILGRTDLGKYHSGTTTCRNFFANYRGGVSSRAGLAYVGTCKQQYPVPPRDIPFQFSLNQGYALEFGEHYMRVKYRGAYVTETAKNVTSVSNLGVFTVTSHGYSAGDWVYDLGNTGFSGLTWIVTPTGANTFTVSDLFGNAITAATASTTGTVSRLYTVVSPYAAVDLPYLKYAQSADVMTLTCVNQSTLTEYLPYDLTRISNTNWTFTQQTFSANILPPSGLTATALTSDIVGTWYSYVVTSVDRDTGEESVASTAVSVQNVDIGTVLGSNTLSWTAVTNASSYNIYAATPSYSIQVPVSSLYGYVGTSLGPGFVDTNITPDFSKVPPQHTDPFARGIIKSVNITAGGDGHYSQQTVGYSVSTGTGSNFSGQPAVSEPYLLGSSIVGGQVVGFPIFNHGKNYLAGDTISFTDSGGQHAAGGLVYVTNPAPGDTLYFNGVKLIFKTPPLPSATAAEIYSPVEHTLALTLQSLSNTLNSSSLLGISVASYSYTATQLSIVYKTPGAVGNAYQYGSTPTSFNLVGGGTAGTAATGSLNIGPQSGTYPSVSAYFQQRRVYANSLNNPDTYWMSQPGLFKNMDSSIPVTAGDAITGTPWAQQVNGIQFLVPMPGGLVVLTGKGAWQVNGGGAAAITPINQTATPQAYNGCNGIVPPITINYDILYVQSKGSIWRDLSYNFFTNIYTGTDLTALSNHLFDGFQIIQAAYAEEPYKLVWSVRNDGILLCLTYLKEQEVFSWTRHDTDGLFVGVCSVTEPPVDAIYVITQRYVRGGWRYYSERMDNRTWNNVEDSYCVDAGLTYGGTPVDALLSVPTATGINVPFTVDRPTFVIAHVGWVVRVGGGQAVIKSYVTNTQVLCDILQPITDVLSDDPNFRPVPFNPLSWTMDKQVSTITGLNHLEGLTVTGLADGSVVAPVVVSNGAITLEQPASKVVLGLSYTCQVQTMYLDVASQSGTIQNRRKDISQMGIRLEASRGVRIGADQPDSSAQQNYAPVVWSRMTELKERTNQVNTGVGIPLYTGDYQQGISSGWNLKGQMAMDQIYPLPANILAVMAYWDSGDDQ